MGEAMKADGMSFLHDAPQQLRMALGLVPQAEPGGRGTEIGAQRQGPFRGQGQTALEAVQGLGLVVGRAAELEPVLPIEGERKPTLAQVKFRSDRLMNSREKSSSSVWNCFSWPWKKL